MSTITASIDVTLLDKARFKKVTRKNGKEAVFCELVLIATPNSEFGDYVIKQSITKEEREAKVEMPILGNAKVFASKGSSRQQPTRQSAKAPQGDDDVPF